MTLLTQGPQAGAALRLDRVLGWLLEQGHSIRAWKALRLLLDDHSSVAVGWHHLAPCPLCLLLDRPFPEVSP